MQSARLKPVLNFGGSSRYAQAPKPNVRVRSNSANGKLLLTNKEQAKLRNHTLVMMAKRTGIFELFWYPTFIIGGIICLLFIRPLDLELVLCVLSLYLCMTANNLVARGFRWGLILSTLNMVIYSYICLSNQVWGELIINVAMYIPLEIMGFIKWKESTTDSGMISDVNKLTVKGHLATWGSTLALTLSIFAILHFGLHQSFAIFNALSIASCLVGNVIRNHRYIEAWLMYIICNLAGIALWLSEAFLSGAVVSLSVLPLVLSYTSTLTNDFNGWAIWEIMYRKDNKTLSAHLAKRKVKISRIAKLKRDYQKFTCRETD